MTTGLRRQFMPPFAAARFTRLYAAANIGRVTDIVAEISAASREQSVGIGEVNKAIVQMDQTTQQNAALVEQAAAAAQSIQDQAWVLNGMVSVFRLAHTSLAIV